MTRALTFDEWLAAGGPSVIPARDQKPPADPLGSFLFGIWYYGRIKDCYEEFNAAIVDRAQRGGIPGESVPPHTCSDRCWCLACAAIFKRWFERSSAEGVV